MSETEQENHGSARPLGHALTWERTESWCGRLGERPLVLFMVVFLLLLIVNAGVIDNPPYWDGIVGRFNTAIWLKQNNFDIVKLWTQEKHYYEGGAASSRQYLFTYVYALLYHVLSPKAVFCVMHVFTLACSSLTFVLFFLMLGSCISPVVALLWCTAAACDPMWSGQSAGIGIEIFVAAAIATVFYFFHKKRYGLVGLWTCSAFLIKTSAREWSVQAGL